jgi:hypothetical protein
MVSRGEPSAVRLQFGQVVSRFVRQGGVSRDRDVFCWLLFYAVLFSFICWMRTRPTVAATASPKRGVSPFRCAERARQSGGSLISNCFRTLDFASRAQPLAPSRPEPKFLACESPPGLPTDHTGRNRKNMHTLHFRARDCRSTARRCRTRPNHLIGILARTNGLAAERFRE